MYRIYVSCGVCLALVTSAQAGYFNFNRSNPSTAGESVVTSITSASGGQPAAAAAGSDPSANYVPDANVDVGSAGSCCVRDRSCCRDLWASYCDDLPSCDRGRRCGRGLGGIFSCEPACAPACCRPTLPCLQLPRFRVPSICLPSFPCWGKPVFGRGLFAGRSICNDGCDTGCDGGCDGGCAAGTADLTVNPTGDGTWVNPTEPTPAAVDPAPATPAGPTTGEPSRKRNLPASGQASTRADFLPAPRAIPAANEGWENEIESAESFDAHQPGDTTPTAAPQAEAEQSGDLLESEGEDLLESAQHRSILRSLHRGMR